MRRPYVYLIGITVLATSAFPVAAPQGGQAAQPPAAPQTPTQPASGPPPAPGGGRAANPISPRPNQPNFIGAERPSPSMNIPAGFTPLFNGENLAGWHVSPTNHHGYMPDFHVQHGMIVGTQRPFGGGGILLTDRKFKNFEVYMEVKPDYGCDSGFFFRSTEWGAAYQVTMDYLPGGGIGNVICEGGMQGCGRAGGAGARGAAGAAGAPGATGVAATAPGAAGAGAPAAAGPAPAAGAPAAGGGGQQARGGGAGGRGGAPPVIGGIPLGSTTPVGEAPWMKVWKREDWNAIRIRVVGDVPHVTVWINDTQITDYTDTANHAVDGAVEGPIAIQVHGGARWVPGGFWRWRVIAVKEL